MYLLLVVNGKAVRWLFNGRLILSVDAVTESACSPQVILAGGKDISKLLYQIINGDSLVLVHGACNNAQDSCC